MEGEGSMQAMNTIIRNNIKLLARNRYKFFYAIVLLKLRYQKLKEYINFL
ncbi:hypothetical protein SAMN04487765_1713 [Tenacibaculum sp. MAR_2010_89]|nr:hypothetical protein SAMN04487765_1713 [Tenacibaculum sp. MAR_2010_89]